MAIWLAPEFLVNQDVLEKANPEHRLPAEHNARLIVVSIGGALVVLAGLVYTARNYRLAHRGQVTDRFTKALERLGSEELYVRIGGVHALKHVMRDSPEHHGDVVEVLVAFIRDQAPRAAEEKQVDDRWMHPPIGTELLELPDEPAADVQAALTALGGRPQRSERERGRIDLSGLHLRRANLWRAQLQKAGLAGTQLQEANLEGAQLQKAELWGAQLQKANLWRAQLQKAELWGAQLQGAGLAGAQLQEANLGEAQLQRTKLWGAQLQGADLEGAQLQGADLDGAQFQGADLDGAQLQRTDLRGVQLTQDQLSSVAVDEHTRLPVGLSRPAAD